MSKYSIVVADAQRARFFSLQDSRTPEVESSPRLVEQAGLANIEKEKPGSPRRGNPANGRAFEDHRERRELEEQRHFSSLIVKESLKQTRKADAHSLVLVAGRKTLGMIRESLATVKTNGLAIYEYGRDLTNDSPEKIQDWLARRKLIPAMKKPVKQVRK